MEGSDKLLPLTPAFIAPVWAQDNRLSNAPCHRSRIMACWPQVCFAECRERARAEPPFSAVVCVVAMAVSAMRRHRRNMMAGHSYATLDVWRAQIASAMRNASL